MTTQPPAPRQHRGWAARHPLLTALAALVLISILMNVFDAESASEAPGTAAPPAEVDAEPGPDEEAASGDSTEDASKRESRDRRRAKGADKEPARPPVEPDSGRRGRYHRVLEVVDGDTVKVAYRGETSVRVIGIDTPETVHPSEPVECGGPRASELADELLSRKRVRLIFDRSQGRTDAYGRTLAYVETRGLGDFGLAMIERGAAAEYTYGAAYARRGDYRAAERRAHRSNRYLWRVCGGTDTPLAMPEPASAPLRQPLHRGGCGPGYEPCVPPYPPDLDCEDVDGPVRVTGSDPHGLDGDGDGYGCTS